MAEHESLDSTARDDDAAGGVRPEARAARVDRKDQTRANLPQPSVPAVASSAADATAAASEPMELQRLAESGSDVPPGRQRTGDPPAERPHT